MTRYIVSEKLPIYLVQNDMYLVAEISILMDSIKYEEQFCLGSLKSSKAYVKYLDFT